MSFKHISKEDMRTAYKWALREQERLGCAAEHMVLTFESDCLDHDKDCCIVSLFLSDGSDDVILRRDWLDEASIKYNVLDNFDEIMEVAPNSVKHMKENGVKLYHYYDGPKGGITRKMKKKFS